MSGAEASYAKFSDSPLVRGDNSSFEPSLFNKVGGIRGCTGATNNVAAANSNPGDNYKLVGVVASESDSFATLINASGDTLTLKLFEELSPGVKLVALNNKEAVFERDEDSYLVINFKNQIVERAR